MRIATGEIEDRTSKVLARAKGGKIGGKRRAMKLTDEQRADIARMAAEAKMEEIETLNLLPVNNA